MGYPRPLDCYKKNPIYIEITNLECREHKFHTTQQIVSYVFHKMGNIKEKDERFERLLVNNME